MATMTVPPRGRTGPFDHARVTPRTERGSRLRILLDADLWSHVTELHEEQALEALERDCSLESVLAPSVLLEVLETPAPDLRDRIVCAMTNVRRTCLPTEAEQAAEEFVNEAARLRPGWLRSFPRTDRLATLVNFWSKRVWINARRDSAAGHSTVLTRDQRAVEPTTQQYLQHAAATDTGTTAAWGTREHSTFLDEAPPDLTAGWRGGEIERWRLAAATRYWNELVTLAPGDPRDPGLFVGLHDWVSPWMSIEQMRRDRADFNAFWYHDVDTSRMIRNWISSNAGIAWAATEPAPGASSDGANLTYLPDTDVVLTADHELASVGEKLRAAAPTWLPPTLHVPTGPSGVVREIETVLKSNHELRGRLPR